MSDVTAADTAAVDSAPAAVTKEDLIKQLEAFEADVKAFTGIEERDLVANISDRLTNIKTRVLRLAGKVETDVPEEDVEAADVPETPAAALEGSDTPASPSEAAGGNAGAVDGAATEAAPVEPAPAA